ncbi:MAG: CARDB domain-containing protein [Candidatus Nanohalobium sp.]
MKNCLRPLVFAVVLLGLAGSASGLDSYLVGPSGKVSGLKYEIGPPTTNAYYQDALGKNPDVGAMICRDDGTLPSQKYVGLSYAVNSSGSPVFSVNSYEAGSSDLPVTGEPVSFNGRSCLRTSLGGFVVSPSEFSGKTPEVDIAAHPGNLSLLVSSSSDGSNPDFINLDGRAEGWFNGEAMYDYDSNEIDYTFYNITAVGHSGNFTYDPSASDRGVSPERPLVVGFCMDRYGDSCPVGSVVSSSSFPSFGFDVAEANVNDQKTFTRYGVVNGLYFDKVEVGADLAVSSMELRNNSVYYSETQRVNFTIANNGSVPVTSDFNVNVTVRNQSGGLVYSKLLGVSGVLPENGGYFRETVSWDAKGKSGVYTVNVDPDSQDDIVELNETSSRSKSFELRPVVVPEIRVDGVEKSVSENEFLSAGTPYNFTLIAESSEGEVLPNSSFTVVEKDAMSSFAPSQMYSRDAGGSIENYSIDVVNEVEFLTGKNGRASITLIPTGNVLLKDEYSHLEIQDKLNYSIYLKGENYKGEKIKFLVNGSVSDRYPLEVKYESYYELPSGAEYKDLPNINSYASTAMNTIHSIFSNFWEVAQ